MVHLRVSVYVLGRVCVCGQTHTNISGGGEEKEGQ